MDLRFKEQALTTAYRPTREAQQFEDELKSMLGFRHRYDAARLSLGRSLAEGDTPEPIPSDAARGTEIKGENLLGQDDVDLWLCAIIAQGEIGSKATVAHFREALEAHWHRGARLLRSELKEAERDDLTFLKRLADLLPDADETIDRGRLPSADRSPSTTGRATARVEIALGSISRTLGRDESVAIVLNDAGVSPHIALMGRTRSGKTLTGLQMALDICQQAAVPLLYIDPKGEFVVDGKLRDWPDTEVEKPQPIDIGHQSIPLDFLPDSGVGRAEVARAAIRFRDSIARCCRSVGDVQRDILREAIEDAILQSTRRDLRAVHDAYEARLQQAGRAEADSVLSRLNEVSGSFDVFEPQLKPADFMRRSWVVGLNRLPGDELKRLVMLLLLDAISDYVIAQPDAPLKGGYRRLRHVLIIDEARKILAERKYESLSDLVRRGAAKGQVVMLLSQDPSDFVGQADDFTTQLSTVIAFACAQSQRGLKDLAGAYGRKLQPQEFSDTYLARGVAFAKLPNRQPERIRVWEAPT